MGSLGLQGGGDLAALLPGAGGAPAPAPALPGLGAPGAGAPLLPPPPADALIPSDVPGAVPGLEQEGDAVGMELIDLFSGLQSQQIQEQEDLLIQLLKSLGISGAEQNPLDGASLGSMLETPEAGNANVALPAPPPSPATDLSSRAGIDGGAGGLGDITGALGI